MSVLGNQLVKDRARRLSNFPERDHAYSGEHSSGAKSLRLKS